jgi:hypothetical protein
MGKMITAAAAVLLLGLWAGSAQAVEIDLTSPDEGGVICPGDFVEVTATVTNETDKKDIIHVDFDLTVVVGGQPVFTGAAKRRLKLDAGETVSETIGAEVPVTPLAEEADVMIDATAKGKKSKTEASDSLFMTLDPDC